MKVLHINQSDISGGAAIAGYRLHQSLLKQRIDSRLLVGRAVTSGDRVAAVPHKSFLERGLLYLSRYISTCSLGIVSTFDIPKHTFYQEAEVLNFHNLHFSYFNYLAISSLTKSKPAVFTLHDMWSFTGHCAYSYDCDRWKTGCGKCPYPESFPPVKRDTTRLEWKLKNWVHSRCDLTIVVPSRWLTEQAKQSMLNRFAIYYIPNGIDLEAYQPLSCDQCRSLLNIPSHKYVLMFGAHILGDPRKGGDLLLKALVNLPPALKAETVLLTFGNGGRAISEAVEIQSLDLGYVSSDRLKSLAYSAADLFILPTRADNLPIVLQESMACGLPMVSFKVGGVPDLVRPGVTGYLAQPEDAQDLSNGIVQLLEDDGLREKMKQNCRAIAQAEYSIELQAERYAKLYRQIVHNAKQFA